MKDSLRVLTYNEFTLQLLDQTVYYRRICSYSRLSYNYEYIVGEISTSASSYWQKGTNRSTSWRSVSILEFVECSSIENLQISETGEIFRLRQTIGH
jgi:hypothetical protein